jgi:hypothetical protein
MQAIFETVLNPCVPFPNIVLRPEICSTIRAPEFKWNQMVHLTADALLALPVIRRVDLPLDTSWNRPDLSRISRRANVVFPDIECVTGRQASSG